MTQYEILKMASIGICARISRETEINERTLQEFGHENSICKRRLEKLNKQFDEVENMMGELERA